MPKKTEQEILEMQVDEMNAEELEAKFSTLERLRREVQVKDRQTRYDIYSAEAEFFLEVAEADLPDHARFMEGHRHDFIRAADEAKRLSQKAGVEPNVKLHGILDDFFENERLDHEQRVHEQRVQEAEERKRVEEERKRLEAEARERRAVEVAAKRSETASLQSGAARDIDESSVASSSRPPSHTAVAMPTTVAEQAAQHRRTASEEPVIPGEHQAGLRMPEARDHTAVNMPPSSSSSSSRDSESVVDPLEAQGDKLPGEHAHVGPKLTAEELARRQLDDKRELGEAVRQRLVSEDSHSSGEQTLEEMRRSLEGSVDEDARTGGEELGHREQRVVERPTTSADLDQGDPVRVFSVPGSGGNYVENSMRDFLAEKHQTRDGADEFFKRMSVSELKGHLGSIEHQEVVSSLSRKIDDDLRRGKLEPVPVAEEVGEVTTYKFKGKALTQTEKGDKISFAAEEGLNAVVRIQRQDEHGDLLDSFDTIEYKNGQVAALVMGQGGKTRLDDIGLKEMRKQVDKGIKIMGTLPEEEVEAKREQEEKLRAEQAVRSLVGGEHKEAEHGTAAHHGMSHAQQEVDFEVRRKLGKVLHDDAGGDVTVHKKAPPRVPGSSRSSSSGRGLD